MNIKDYKKCGKTDKLDPVTENLNMFHVNIYTLNKRMNHPENYAQSLPKSIYRILI